jgi:hypothetical protein
MMRKKDAILNDELNKRGITFEDSTMNDIKIERNDWDNLLDLMTDK